MKTTQHGGKREGAGNKPKPPEKRLGNRVTVNLDDATMAALDAARGTKKRPAWILSLIQKELVVPPPPEPKEQG